MKMKTALTIAGSDCIGDAGIQADLKTMTMNGVYAMSAVTALSAENTTGVIAVQESTPEFLKQQLDAVCEDIFPDAVKIGMVSSGGSCDAQYPGGAGPLRPVDQMRGRYAGGGKRDQWFLRVRGALKGRPQRERCQRPAVRRRGGGLV